MFKRVTLFIATNLLVVATISIVISALGLHSYLGRHGIDYQRLITFCFIWGMGGAFISLLLSKFFAKLSMGIVVINPNNATREERYLLELIYRLASQAGLKTMPTVGIYPSAEVNAFATGPTRNNALVAVSSGLLTYMNRDEIEGVLGHEIAHIANGDMVTMTLLQGIVNSFALILSRLASYAITTAMSRSDEHEGEISYFANSALTFIFDMVFTFLGSILIASYSRWREYRADQGGASLSSTEKMVAALKRLQFSTAAIDNRSTALAAFKIAQQPSWLNIFSSHPPLEKRIARLVNNKRA